MPQIAILVAAYNAEQTLPRCLDSLCQQSLQDIEIWCVDDCSTDDTLSLLRTRARLDPRLHVLQTPENSGQAVARNLALQEVTAPFVCMVDADDWLSTDALQQALDIFNNYPLTDCCVFRLVQYYEDGREEPYGLPAQLELGSLLTGKEAFELCLDGWQLHGLYVTRTELHRQYPFDTTTRLYSDDNTSRIHYLHSREVRACAGTYYYRKHADSMTISFNLRRFDFMEAQLSLKWALREVELSRDLLRRVEGGRWVTFLACYRLYLEHEEEILPEDRQALQQRFRTILHTFRPSRLALRYRWKPGYWLMINTRCFDWQQRGYCWMKKKKKK
ncbi:MAG: glycosyltransferase [Bacteroidaceae bacterium]|nr:glycosyltransferase [Bacteroidaceae bacterium]